MSQLAADDFCSLKVRAWTRSENGKGRETGQSRTLSVTTRISKSWLAELCSIDFTEARY